MKIHCFGRSSSRSPLSFTDSHPHEAKNGKSGYERVADPAYRHTDASTLGPLPPPHVLPYLLHSGGVDGEGGEEEEGQGMGDRVKGEEDCACHHTGTLQLGHDGGYVHVVVE